MNDHPIIFSAPMIRALLDGRKTMTRRIAWHPTKKNIFGAPWPSPWQRVLPGDQLWCREAWRQAYPEGMGSHGVIYRADKFKALGMDEFSDRHKWKPSIYMPRRFSRLTLVVTATKVEPLNACTDEDAIAEGVVWSEQWRGWVIPGVDHPNPDFPVLSRGTAREAYAALWDVLHGSGKWLSNPEVCAISFRVHKQNIDQMRSAA